ncbi:aminotransferase class I/II-fold pyridoxal phosphate-dependent enzyme [Streptosporangium sp. NPDC020072]|uniref:aminotransferase class I/II-fold pyridoxal phosphate-dependent enzyme n=1 Tax=Streptosporangium sp. NPDC020072 TaxID=3154788 RepID=UPI0034431186
MTPYVQVAGPLSHTRQWWEGVVQSVAPPHVIDLGPGYLDPGLLPADLLAASYAGSLAAYGSAALAYGDDRGALPLRTRLAARVRERDGVPCDPANVLVTAGTSHALHLIATTLAAPGDVVLVDESCYDLGRLILADCGLRAYEVAGDEYGMSPYALAAALAETRGRVAFAYLNPTFHNPTGLVVPLERRHALLDVARNHQTLIVEDDAYADLLLNQALGMEPGPDSDVQDTPPPMASLARHRGVIRLLTFSKSLAPGLRLGWLVAAPELVDRLAGHGVFRSGGCPNHTASLAVATLMEEGHYDRHLTWLRDRLRERRDTLVDALTAHLNDAFLLDRPAGGFFVWLRSHHPEHALMTAAEQADVYVAAGSRFGPGRRPARRPDGHNGDRSPGDLGHDGGNPVSAVRLAYSFNDPGRLARAVERLAGVWNVIPGKRGPGR